MKRRPTYLLIGFIVMGLLVIGCLNQSKPSEDQILENETDVDHIEHEVITEQDNDDEEDSEANVFDYRFLDFHMVDEFVGWAFSKEEIYKTEDGGVTWNIVMPPQLNKASLPTNYSYPHRLSYDFINSEEGWISVNNGGAIRIFNTSDGGITWNDSEIQVSNIFSFEIFFFDSETGWIFVESEPYSGSNLPEADKMIYHTNDGGQNWTLKSSTLTNNETLPKALQPTGFSFNSELIGCVTYFYFGNEFIPIYCSTDGGEEWGLFEIEKPKEFINYNATAYSPVFDMDEQEKGVLLVKFSSEYGHQSFVKYVTHNHGQTWTAMTKIQATHSHFENYNLGWATKSNENLLYITNADGEWNEVNPNITLSEVKKMQFISSEVGWALLDKLYKTEDGGKTWIQN